ncbi:hypothetical protein NFI99_12680 (plasmid) [Burkholderia glumae]|uniref:Transmembrane protein n=1 Tax=Burkholderia glumae TaxID=337 RepID=A0ABY5BCH9_BURGL|nr:hypothetical protein [Burkholderia glumae]USS44141.1 hypothetical protein NFI99_12680 [Burkholderia glumae]
MEDPDKIRTHSLLASVAIIFFFGGLASFPSQVTIPVFGLVLNHAEVLPWLLVASWLYFYLRFISLSRAKHGEELRSLLAGCIKEEAWVKRFFPPARYGLASEPDIATLPWLPREEQKQLGSDGVKFDRFCLGRVFEFSYQTPRLHVHFVDQHGPLKSDGYQRGRIGVDTIAYWKCVWYEALYMLRQIPKRPIVVYYYFPRVLFVVALGSMAWWAAWRIMKS